MSIGGEACPCPEGEEECREENDDEEGAHDGIVASACHDIASIQSSLHTYAL